MPNSLADLATFVDDDAFRIRVTRPFEPEELVLGTYTFLPFVRTGIAAAVGDPEANRLRARVSVTVPVQAEGVPDRDVSKTLAVRGPGDVLGFDETQVVRRYPEAGTFNAEPNFLAQVEFDRPDFPWLFSPAAPKGDRLAPWISLVVLRATRAELLPGRAELPPRVRTTLSELQPLAYDAWAWAHAQIVGPAAGAPSIVDRLSPHYGQTNLSRLLCPRRLDDTESYLACVVPTFDAGRRAGLGLAGEGTLGFAWERKLDGSDADQQIELPVYHSWRFQTGREGDFEALAEKLRPRAAPWSVGRRTLDASRPGSGLNLGANAAGRVQIVRGPLVSPVPRPPDQEGPDDDAAWSASKTEQLRDKLNEPDELAGRPVAPSPTDLPRVGPTIYGQHHAGTSRVETNRAADWFGQLNLAPTNRVVAGLGTRVVQMDQEPLMQSAWAQIGDVEGANDQIRRAQMARFVGASLHARHLAPLADGDLLQATRALHGRVLGDASLTVHGTVADSAVADAATSAAFRRAARPLGPLARYASERARTPPGRFVVREGSSRDFQRPYVDLDGINRVSEAAARALDPRVVGGVLELGTIDADRAREALLDIGRRLPRAPALPDALTPEAVAQLRLPADYNVAAIGAQRVLETVERARPRGSGPAARARAASHWSLVSQLEQSVRDAAGGHGDVARRAGRLTTRLARLAGIDDRPAEPLGATVTLGGDDEMGGAAASFAFDRRRAAFRLAGHGDRLAQRVTAAAGLGARSAARGFSRIAAELVRPEWPGTPVRPSLTFRRAELLAEIHPRLTVTRRIVARLGPLPNWPGDWFADGLVQPIMAAPVFRRPMYQALEAYDREWLIPGLGKIADPDFVTLLETNPRFVEAFFVGLSHEMGRELLWRGYPTDQRGTYFRRFFNAHADELVQDIHRFAQTPLGSHLAPSLTQPRIVLMVRGELIRRYPHAVLLALRAGGVDDGGYPVFIDPTSDPTTMARVLFHGHLDPDIVMAGFELTAADVRNAADDAGWWFIVAEHPTAPRFGLDTSREPGKPLTRDTLSWADLKPRLGFLDASTIRNVPEAVGSSTVTTWGRDAASVAHLLLQNAARAAFRGKTMIAQIQGGP